MTSINMSNTHAIYHITAHFMKDFFITKYSKSRTKQASQHSQWERLNKT